MTTTTQPITDTTTILVASSDLTWMDLMDGIHDEGLALALTDSPDQDWTEDECRRWLEDQNEMRSEVEAAANEAINDALTLPTVACNIDVLHPAEWDTEKKCKPGPGRPIGEDELDGDDPSHRQILDAIAEARDTDAVWGAVARVWNDWPGPVAR